MKYKIIILISIVILILFGLRIIKKINFNTKYKVGQIIDSYNNVSVFFNGGISHTKGRNLTKDGYNLGIKYQCVEFVKRYYYEYLNHKMPDPYGNAIDFYNLNLRDGEWNEKRNLKQCKNGGITSPKINDIVIFNKNILNRFGHVAIITEVKKETITIIQQNRGSFGKSRELFFLKNNNGKYYIENKRILGWLTKPKDILN